MANNVDDLGLPPMSFINDLMPLENVPEFTRKYIRRQGPASVKKDRKGRTFTIGGEAANRILQCIFADQHLTRGQIAKIVGCSPSRVTEVIWGLDAAVKRGELSSWPRLPRTASEAANDADEESANNDADEESAESEETE